ncbi:MAG TPA: hypothetical protein VFM16_05245, partial [Holophagaceae bacterium]|nr:hypothetical protein [Holophagaceae bacterium]
MPRTFARLGLLGLSLVAATALPAQGTQTGNLTGTVREAATGKPIPGAHVTVRTPQGDRTATTNAEGQ